jgi:hypothetical protein
MARPHTRAACRLCRRVALLYSQCEQESAGLSHARACVACHAIAGEAEADAAGAGESRLAEGTTSARRHTRAHHPRTVARYMLQRCSSDDVSMLRTLTHVECRCVCCASASAALPPPRRAQDEYGRKEELFKRREENLRAKDLELQEALVLFNKFLKENEQKRRRADHRANDEIKKRIKWERQIVTHRESVTDLRARCAEIKGSVMAKEKYQKYLERVQDAYASHFDEIGSIITRYTTLITANTEMMQKQKEHVSGNEILRVAFNDYKKKQYNKTLSLNNDIASQSRELEEGVKRTSEVEESMIHQEKQESEEQRISTQIIL